jgi:hypothetical protein
MSNKPKILSIYNPSEILKYLTFYSPIILIIGVVSLSFIFQNFKGIFYLGVMILIVVCREFIYMKFMTSPAETTLPNEEKTTTIGGRKLYKGGDPNYASEDCTSVLYSSNLKSNGSYSAFIFSFTLMYIFLPMFINQNVNMWMVFGLSMYFVIDTFVKQRSGCVDLSNVFVNVIVGFALSATLVCVMINSPGLSNLLFFNDYSSNKEICTMPKKQTFKCAVYKNGELIGSSTT